MMAGLNENDNDGLGASVLPGLPTSQHFTSAASPLRRLFATGGLGSYLLSHVILDEQTKPYLLLAWTTAWHGDTW